VSAGVNATIFATDWAIERILELPPTAFLPFLRWVTVQRPEDDTVRECFRHRENDMSPTRSVASIICIAVGVAGAASPVLAEA
jgi:hypothetical protein